MNVQKTYNDEGQLVSLKLYLDCTVNGVQRRDLGRALWNKVPAEMFRVVPAGIYATHSESPMGIIGCRDSEFVVRYTEDVPLSQLQSLQTYWTSKLTELVEFEEKLKIVEDARDKSNNSSYSIHYYQSDY